MTESNLTENREDETRENEHSESNVTEEETTAPSTSETRLGDYPDLRTVVVTGTSTGIGYGIAQELIAHGYQVVGTVRKQEDADRIRAELGERLQPILVDVADDDEVIRAAGEIREIVGERGLAGLVNNAGIAVAGPLMHVDLEELRYQFDVNVVSVVAMTQALLPLLGGRKESAHPPGRVINISSVSAHTTYPFLAPYAASKRALESISEGMRRELALYGIGVTMLVVGAVQTPIWEKVSDEDLERYAATDYAEAVAQMHATTSELGKGGMPVARVAQSVRQTLEQPKPKARVILVNDYWRGWLIPRLMPESLVDWAVAKQFGLRPSK